MRKKLLHINLCYLLLANLLFSQLIIGFFHTHKEQETTAYKQSSALDQTKVILKNKTEHCKVCSLDIIHELFFSDVCIFQFYNESSSLYQLSLIDFKGTFTFYTKDRAPPVSLLPSK